jgi:hypothetical protein
LEKNNRIELNIEKNKATNNIVHFEINLCNKYLVKESRNLETKLRLTNSSSNIYGSITEFRDGNRICAFARVTAPTRQSMLKSNGNSQSMSANTEPYRKQEPKITRPNAGGKKTNNAPIRSRQATDMSCGNINPPSVRPIYIPDRNLSKSVSWEKIIYMMLVNIQKEPMVKKAIPINRETITAGWATRVRCRRITTVRAGVVIFYHSSLQRREEYQLYAHNLNAGISLRLGFCR